MASLLSQRPVMWTIFLLLFDLTAKGRVSAEDDRQVIKFWTSTGFSPENPCFKADVEMLSSDMETNLRLIGSIPDSFQVRVHWLLQLIKLKKEADRPIQDDGSWTPSWDFSELDVFIQRMFSSGLTIGFEIMGNPSKMFSDFTTDTRLNNWYHLIKSMLQRYIGIYGREWVSKWRLETWNEPDHHDFCRVNFTLATYLSYYDVTLAAVRDAGRGLRFGGPGGSCREPHFTKFCYGLLEHSFRANNTFNNSIANRMDFFSIHAKGKGQEVDSIIDEEITRLKRIYELFPEVRDLPLLNDEGDPMKGWWKHADWRAGAVYAGLILENVVNHKDVYMSPKLAHDLPEFELLSSDNAFLSFPPDPFSQRTLFARFPSSNSSYERSFMLKKPVFKVFSFLSSLNGRYLASPMISSKSQSVFSFDFKKNKHGNSAKSPSNISTVRDLRNVSSLMRTSDAFKFKTGQAVHHPQPLVLGSELLVEKKESHVRWVTTLLVSFSSFNMSNDTKSLKSRYLFNFKNMPSINANQVDRPAVVIRRISDADDANVHLAWRRMGQPTAISVQQFLYLQNFTQTKMQILQIESRDHLSIVVNLVKEDTLSHFSGCRLLRESLISCACHFSEIFQFQICIPDDNKPSQPYSLSLATVAPSIVLATWKHDSTAICVASWELQFSPMDSWADPVILEVSHEVETSMFFPWDATNGFFRVLAVDPWGRRSKPSVPVTLGI